MEHTNTIRRGLRRLFLRSLGGGVLLAVAWWLCGLGGMALSDLLGPNHMPRYFFWPHVDDLRQGFFYGAWLAACGLSLRWSGPPWRAALVAFAAGTVGLALACLHDAWFVNTIFTGDPTTGLLALPVGLWGLLTHPARYLGACALVALPLAAAAALRACGRGLAIQTAGALAAGLMGYGLFVSPDVASGYPSFLQVWKGSHSGTFYMARETMLLFTLAVGLTFPALAQFGERETAGAADEDPLVDRPVVGQFDPRRLAV